MTVQMTTLNYYFPLAVSEEAIAVVARLVSNHVRGDAATTEKLLGGWAIYVSGEKAPKAGSLEEVRLSTGVYTLMTGLVVGYRLGTEGTAAFDTDVTHSLG